MPLWGHTDSPSGFAENIFKEVFYMLAQEKTEIMKAYATHEGVL